MKEAISPSGPQPERIMPKKPIVVSTEREIVRAKSNFAAQLRIGEFSESELTNYIREHVRTIDIDGVRVHIINKARGKLDPIAKAFIHSSSVKAAVVEYFEPELSVNQERSKLRFMLGKHWREERSGETVQFANQVGEECKAEKKPVVVSDIANKPAYVVNYLAEGGVAFALGLSQFITGPNIGAVYLALNFLKNRVDEQRGKGLFDAQKIHTYERLLLDSEDARRVYAAEGIKLLAGEYASSGQDLRREGDISPEIVIFYPEAHAKRIADYLLHPARIKRAIYRLFQGLDFSVRRYEWKDILANATQDESLAGWQRVSNRKIPLIA